MTEAWAWGWAAKEPSDRSASPGKTPTHPPSELRGQGPGWSSCAVGRGHWCAATFRGSVQEIQTTAERLLRLAECDRKAHGKSSADDGVATPGRGRSGGRPVRPRLPAGPAARGLRLGFGGFRTTDDAPRRRPHAPVRGAAAARSPGWPVSIAPQRGGRRTPRSGAQDRVGARIHEDSMSGSPGAQGVRALTSRSRGQGSALAEQARRPGARPAVSELSMFQTSDRGAEGQPPGGHGGFVVRLRRRGSRPRERAGPCRPRCRDRRRGTGDVGFHKPKFIRYQHFFDD